MSEKELRETLQEAASRLRYSGDHFHDIGCETRAKSDWDASEACLAEIDKIAGTLSPSPERQTMTDESVEAIRALIPDGPVEAWGQIYQSGYEDGLDDAIAAIKRASYGGGK